MPKDAIQVPYTFYKIINVNSVSNSNTFLYYLDWICGGVDRTKKGTDVIYVNPSPKNKRAIAIYKK